MKDKIGKIVISLIALTLLSPLLWSLISGLIPEKTASAVTNASQKSEVGAQQLYSKCVPCHGANADGTEAYPPLNTLGKARLTELIKAYQKGAMGNGNNQSIMHVQVEGMSTQDVDALTDYVSTLKPNEQNKKQDKKFKDKKMENQLDTTSISS